MDVAPSARSVNDDDLQTPFVGHLPGFREQCEARGTNYPDDNHYIAHLQAAWRRLLDSPASQDESLVQEFLERHSSLLPGPFSVDGTSGHVPFPMALISKPKLPGLSSREPDFMWIATDSGSVYAVLIEIETPHKRWFQTANRTESHSEFTHAQGQLADWRAWLDRPADHSAFLDLYEVPTELRHRKLEPRFVLIHGRRAEYEGDTARTNKKAALARDGERLMSFDRLTPDRDALAFACVKKDEHGYRAHRVPPTLAVFSHGDEYQLVRGWDEVLDGCPDMTATRRDYLREVLRGQIRTGADSDMPWQHVEWL